MNRSAHKTEGVNRTKAVWSYPFVSTGNDPRKGWRIPLNEIKYNEQRNEETCYGYCNDYQPHAVKRMFDYKNGMLYDMRWDEAGNLGQVSMGKPGEMFERGRFLFWTEDCCGCEHRLCQSNVVSNRMHAAVDDKYFSYYVYDHSGGSCASREQSQACLSYAEMEQRRRSQRRLKHQYDGIHQTFHDCIGADPCGNCVGCRWNFEVIIVFYLRSLFILCIFAACLFKIIACSEILNNNGRGVLWM